MTILGISVGTTLTGVCIMQRGKLIDWQAHKYQTKWSDEKLQAIVNQYREYFKNNRINAVMVKVPPLRYHNEEITLILQKLEEIVRKYGITKYDLITQVEIKNKFLIRNTDELIECTVKKFPVLQQTFRKGEHNNHKYYRKIYEAVMSAYIFSLQLQFNSE
ncbi:hypothetical protein [Leadbetterella sp. DM7]|uniref:hypothetical protein n=1 Tax=Leadbetterella sp. DM7 TaxID=3235085 RepID=UPI00349EA304